MQVNRHPDASADLIDKLVPQIRLLSKFTTKMVQTDFSFANILANKISKEIGDLKQNTCFKNNSSFNQYEIMSQPDPVTGIFMVDQAHFSSIQAELPPID